MLPKNEYELTQVALSFDQPVHIYQMFSAQQNIDEELDEYRVVLNWLFENISWLPIEHPYGTDHIYIAGVFKFFMPSDVIHELLMLRTQTND